MKMIDIITQRINQLLDLSGTDVAEIQRNELASLLGCVPSQINYVLTSRFTPEQGYIVESRRGGGGYIRITRVRLDRSSALMHIINSIGPEVDAATARVITENCVHNQLFSEEAGVIMDGALSSTAFREIPPELRDRVRAAILKQMMVTQI